MKPTKNNENKMADIKYNPNDVLDFGMPEEKHSIIKVIGVGGGGGNAVNHMYNEGIHDVSFVVCNTDNQALNDSPIPVKLQLGSEGLGAGNRPAKAKAAAEESAEDIRRMLNDGTRMAFITAGMGGGTGTGAGPVIAQISKEMDILTVGIVTIPFRFEGIKKIDQALDGVEEMAKHVDALLVINNERLRSIYPDLTVDDALNSPLLNDNDVFNSKKILINITSAGGKDGKAALMMEEMNDVNDFMAKFGTDYESKLGLSTDPELGNKVKVTILATGFGITNVDGMQSHINAKQTREDVTKLAEQQEREARNMDRRDKYYGGDNNSRRTKHRPNTYIFRPEDLDNDDIISAVEQTPTYKRTREILKSIGCQNVNVNVQPKDANGSTVDVQGVISFI